MRASHYAAIIEDLRRHVRDRLLAYNYAKQLKALQFKAPAEALEQVRQQRPELFVRPPSHHMPGLGI